MKIFRRRQNVNPTPLKYSSASVRNCMAVKKYVAKGVFSYRLKLHGDWLTLVAVRGKITRGKNVCYAMATGKNKGQSAVV